MLHQHPRIFPKKKHREINQDRRLCRFRAQLAARMLPGPETKMVLSQHAQGEVAESPIVGNCLAELTFLPSNEVGSNPLDEQFEFYILGALEPQWFLRTNLQSTAEVYLIHGP